VTIEIQVWLFHGMMKTLPLSLRVTEKRKCPDSSVVVVVISPRLELNITATPEKGHSSSFTNLGWNLTFPWIETEVSSVNEMVVLDRCLTVIMKSEGEKVWAIVC
jgi:hypothetical protein